MNVTGFVVVLLPLGATTVSVIPIVADPKLPQLTALSCSVIPVKVVVPPAFGNVHVYDVIPGFGVEMLASNVHFI